MSSKGTYPIALLGLVADHKRKIKRGYEFDKYFPKAQGTYDIVNSNGNVKMTVDEMDAYVHQTLADTAKIAPLLKGETLAGTCKNIWNFIYDHIQYKLDKDGVEELRRPRRTWSDRFTGVDCDCMSIFTSSILTNLGIKHKFRITKYEANWQHVYVIVPLPEDPKKYYVIDCVLNEFNYQKTYTDKFDHRMETTALLGGIPIARLGSIGETTIDSNDELQAILTGSHIGCLEPIDGLGDSETQISDKPFLDSILQHIIATRNYILKNPDSVTIIGGAKNHLKMLDYAIASWNTPDRDAALEILAKEEERWNKESPSMNGVEDAEDEFLGNLESLLEGNIEIEEYLEGLGKLKLGGAGKKFFSNVKKSVQTVKQTVQKTNQKIIAKAKEIKKTVDTKVKIVAKKVIEKTKEVAKKVGAAIKKFLVLSNPLTLLMRAGFLMAMKVNLFGMAERLYPALLTQGEAERAGINAILWNKSKAGLDKVAKVFEKIGGKRSKLEKYIKTGRTSKKVKLNGIGSLGEPYTTAAAIVAAGATLLTAAAKMKEAGINKRDYEQLKRQSAQKSSVRGFGSDDVSPNVDDVQDVDVPEQEQFETDSSGNIDESKKGLAKFIDAIKKFFSRNKKVADQPMNELMEQEQAEAPSNPPTSSAVMNNSAASGGAAASSSAMANEVATNTEYSPETTTTQESYESAESASSEEGFFAKAGRFVKENPGKTIAGAALLTTALVFAFSPKARQAVFGKKQKGQPAFNGVGQVVKYRKGKKIKRSRKFLPKNSKVKRIVLK
ncbi:MAG: transglutaminase-like domain-containing protein [Bacteroidota bacterium]